MPRPKLPQFIHAPWDGGAVSGIFAGSVLEQKTIATRCGRRVKFSEAPADVAPTCPKCAEALDAEKRSQAILDKYAEDLRTHGLDYALEQFQKVDLPEAR